MSHEIRTPMNAVIGMTGLLLGTGLDVEQKNYAELVRSSADALLGIINDILDFSKIEAGKLELERLDFNVREVIEEVADLLAVKAREKGLAFVCVIDPRIPAFLTGDPGRLRQILINLASNAIKFTHKGKISIRVGSAEETTSQLSLRIEVSDTGIGIPEDRIDTLFQSFSQVDASTTRRFGGTGLGLAISKRLVEAMGGSIGVHSKAGEGSTFYFNALFGKQPYPELRTAQKTSVLNENASISSHNKNSGVVAHVRHNPPEREKGTTRILLAEDNSINRKMALAMLKKCGYSADAVENGRQVIEALQENAYHLLLMDVQMPEMDGLEATRRIRGPHSGVLDPEIPIIAMTAMAMKGDRERCLEAGMNDYISKPIDPEEMLSAIRRYAS